MIVVQSIRWPVDAHPVTGTTYAPSDSLASGQSVIYASTGTSTTDTPPPGVVHYAVFARDALPNWSGPATAFATVPAGAQDASITVDTSTGDVTVTQPPNWQVSATWLDANSHLLVSARSVVGRVTFNPKWVITSVTGGTLDTTDGMLGSDPYVRAAPAADFGDVVTAEIPFAATDTGATWATAADAPTPASGWCASTPTP